MGPRIAAVLLAFAPCAQALADAIPDAWLKPGSHAFFQEAKAGLLKANQGGQDVLSPMVRAYEASTDNNQKAWIAELFYNLGLESKAAEKALMKDIHTQDQHLRLQVQWALGRVSNDDEVVDRLLDNMMHDRNPLFRDKAACALAYDQIHLKPIQKVKLYAGLIQGLSSEEPQVRQIAIQALRIHTGQDKGFNPGATPEERQAKIEIWRKWLEEYKANL
jgi:HEAT repeat protein